MDHTQNYNLNLPEHGYRNWDVPNNENFGIIDSALKEIDDSKINLNLSNSTAITDCILEVPQDIKLELNNGTLILKEGSKVYVPNGSGVFDEVTIENDISLTYSDTGTFFAFLYSGNNNLRHFGVSQCFSGVNAPTGQTYMMWYDTTNNLVKITEDGGSTWTPGYSFPICVLTDNTSIDQVFNGFGYIGSTLFSLPGIKGLIPNGRNEDGSLKNIELLTTNVALSTLSGTNPQIEFFLNDSIYLGAWSYVDYYVSDTFPVGDYNCVYMPTRNEYWYKLTGDYTKAYQIHCGRVSVVNDKITSIVPNAVLRVADYNDFVDCHVIVDTYANGASWYRVYSDGWCEQGGRYTISTTGAGTITFLKGFANTDYHLLLSKSSSDSSTWNIMTYIHDFTTTTAPVKSNLTGYTLSGDWYACGYIS